MRFLVFGAGALGSLVGGLLSRKHQVVLVARREHVAAIRRRGLRITGLTEAVVHPEAVEEVPDVRPLDVVILTVKAYHTEAAMEALKPYHKTSMFLSLQNGLGNEEIMSRRARRVLGGVTNQGVTFLGPGRIRHAGAGETYIGPFSGTTEEDARRVVQAFHEVGMPCHLARDIRRELWMKVLVNACINPLTALLGVENGFLAGSQALGNVVEAIVEEGVRVAEAHGVSLEREEVLKRAWSVVNATAKNRSSMLQDLDRGRRTEVEAINGAIARLGKERGIRCPVNALLTALVQAAEARP